MATAGRLGRAGYKVTVLEKNDTIGGRCQSRHVAAPGVGGGEFRFDTGPSLLLMRQKYEEAFEALGVPLPTELRRVSPAYRVFFGDGDSMELLYDVNEMSKQLEAVEEGAGLAYLEWLAKARAMFTIGGGIIENDMKTLTDMADPNIAVPLLAKVPPWQMVLPHDLALRGFFKSEKLRSLFTFQDLYVGLSPYNAPGAFSLLAGTELIDGIWYPVGGFQKMRDGLAQAAKDNGVEIRTCSPVRRVVVEGGRARGVELESGEIVDADVVVANPDVPYVYDELMAGEEARSKAEDLASKEYSAGVVSFNWCINGRASELLHHSIFLSDKPKEAWNRATSAADVAADGRCPRPNFYVHTPSRTDDTCAPEGCESIMVLLPIGNAQEVAGNGTSAGKIDWDAMVESGREAVLRRLDEAGVRVTPREGGEPVSVREAIASEFVYTPAIWEKMYNLKYGAAFGLAHGLTQLAYFRPGNGPIEDGDTDGLYFVGASTRPGNGVPLVLMSAAITANRILEDRAAATAQTAGVQ
jgi:phytoene desaturase (3,4-didehydrolycopene-forming)|uniref:Amine oxidase domain-containing protein n=1 Tax=Prasinoderma singulare TaxID=676789 RepID=A0A7S3BGA5_9VIRI